MKKVSETKSIGDIINTLNFSQKSKSFENPMKHFIKHSTIFSFWADIVGAKFARYTKPVSIKYSKLYVSAKSPVIIQELSLYKDRLLRKVNTYSNPLGIEIKDIVFDYKSYLATNAISTGVEDKPENIQGKDLKSVKLDEEYKEKISDSIDKINGLTKEQKDKLVSKIFELKKADIKRNS